MLRDLLTQKCVDNKKQSFSDPAISSDTDSDWSPKFGLGLGLGLGLKKSWLFYTLTQNYQSMKTYDVLTIVDICACGL
jgi:hypothetical protein